MLLGVLAFFAVGAILRVVAKAVEGTDAGPIVLAVTLVVLIAAVWVGEWRYVRWRRGR